MYKPPFTISSKARYHREDRSQQEWILGNNKVTRHLQVAIGFVGNYAPGGLSPQTRDMPVIL